jgi:hypothetical protein
MLVVVLVVVLVGRVQERDGCESAYVGSDQTRKEAWM